LDVAAAGFDAGAGESTFRVLDTGSGVSSPAESIPDRGLHPPHLPAEKIGLHPIKERLRVDIPPEDPASTEHPSLEARLLTGVDPANSRNTRQNLEGLVIERR
jgi:hypothetical protein